jgi:hypothetical protein
VFLPATVIAGIFGMNTIEFVKDDNSLWLGGSLIILSSLSGFATIKSKHKPVKVLSAVVLLGCIATSLFFMPQKESTTNTQIHLTKKEKINVTKPTR